MSRARSFLVKRANSIRPWAVTTPAACETSAPEHEPAQRHGQSSAHGDDWPLEELELSACMEAICASPSPSAIGSQGTREARTETSASRAITVARVFAFWRRLALPRCCSCVLMYPFLALARTQFLQSLSISRALPIPLFIPPSHRLTAASLALLLGCSTGVEYTSLGTREDGVNRKRRSPLWHRR
jgi:hypothetical protein